MEHAKKELNVEEELGKVNKEELEYADMLIDTMDNLSREEKELTKRLFRIRFVDD